MHAPELSDAPKPSDGPDPLAEPEDRYEASGEVMPAAEPAREVPGDPVGPAPELAPDVPAAPAGAEVPGGERHPAPIVPRSTQRRIERDGDRVDDWVRPDYRTAAGSTGEYWTPAPESSYSDGGYGWPVPVERLPEIPPYPPASGFDVAAVGESTAVVPEWPPAKPSDRIQAPRSWPMTNDVPAPTGAPEAPGWPMTNDVPAPTGAPEAPAADAAANVPGRTRVSRWAALDRQTPERAWRPASPEPPAEADRRERSAAEPARPDFAEQPAWSRLGPQRRSGSATGYLPAVTGAVSGSVSGAVSGSVSGYLPAVEESTQMLPSVDGLVAERGTAERPRSRPRPRPRPQQPDRSNVYVSRHAAEPG